MIKPRAPCCDEIGILARIAFSVVTPSLIWQNALLEDETDILARIAFRVLRHNSWCCVAIRRVTEFMVRRAGCNFALQHCGIIHGGTDGKKKKVHQRCMLLDHT